MKFVINILLAFSCIGFLYPQSGNPQYPDNEFSIQVQNAPNRTIVFELIPIGPNWAKTTSCNISAYNDQTTYTSSLSAGDDGYITCGLNGFEYRFYNEGNYTDIHGCAQSTAGLKPMRNGFYQVNVKENSILKTIAYFDWRDMGLPVGYVCNTCTGNDFTIRYHAQYEQLWFWNAGGVEITNQSPDLILANGQIITWAEWRCDGRVLTPFWSNGLVSLPSRGGNPKVIWGPYNDNNYATQGYYIYRAVNSSNTPPPLNQFGLVATLNNATYDWTDYDFSTGGPLRVHYYVKAILVPLGGGSSTTSSPTNVVTQNVGLYKEFDQVIQTADSFVLEQNFPNPFNPETKISYSVKVEGLITIKVFDVLGNEVAELLNEQKEAGYYEVNFDASNLPSGVYIYKMQVYPAGSGAGKFTAVNKMILMR